MDIPLGNGINGIKIFLTIVAFKKNFLDKRNPDLNVQGKMRHNAGGQKREVDRNTAKLNEDQTRKALG